MISHLIDTMVCRKQTENNSLILNRIEFQTVCKLYISNVLYINTSQEINVKKYLKDTTFAYNGYVGILSYLKKKPIFNRICRMVMRNS